MSTNWWGSVKTVVMDKKRKQINWYIKTDAANASVPFFIFFWGGGGSQEQTSCCQTSCCVKHLDFGNCVSVKLNMGLRSLTSYNVTTIDAKGGLALGRMRPSEDSNNGHPPRRSALSLEKWWISQRRRRNNLGCGTSLFTIRCGLF